MRKLLLAIFAAVGLLVPWSPALASSTLPTSQWNFYTYADQATPYTTSAFYVQIKNNVGHQVDQVVLYVPNASRYVGIQSVAAKYQNGADIESSKITYTACSGTPCSGPRQVTIGQFANKLQLQVGQTFEAWITVSYECIPNGTGGCLTADTATYSSDWAGSLVTWSDAAGNQYPGSPFAIQGNSTFTLTNHPNPSQQPKDWGTSSPYSQALQQKGLGNVQGLLPAGPVDSLVILPLNLVNQLISSAGGSVTAPTITVYGSTRTLPDSSSLYDPLGSTFAGVAFSVVSFAILLPWLKSIYSRLQRATTFDSDASDTWGVL